jgi:integrase
MSRATHAAKTVTMQAVQFNDFPVSTLADHSGAGIPLSWFDDSLWDFSPHMEVENLSQSNKEINWRISLGDGSFLTDPKHGELLRSTKLFIWSLRAIPAEGTRRASFKSLIGAASEIRPLLRWMVAQGISTFSALEGHTESYVVAAGRLQKTDGEASANVIYNRLALIEKLHRQLDKLPDALQTHPWPGTSAGELAGLRGRSGRVKTKRIPEHDALTLARLAISYVTERGPDLLHARDRLQLATSLEEGRHPVHASIARTQMARSLDLAGQNELSTSLGRLRTACYVVIALFSGIRDSEMKSLPINCVAPGRTRDGVDVTYIHGTIYKTGERPKRWLVPPIVAQAVDLLIRLSAPLREQLKADCVRMEEQLRGRLPTDMRKRLLMRLNEGKRHVDKLFLGRSRTQPDVVRVLTNIRLNELLKEFCNHHNILQNGGAGARLHSHQFRRTYAYFVARSELGDLVMLREHFGHHSIDMTAGYASDGADGYDADIELLEWIAEERDARQREIIGDIASDSRPLGSKSDWLDGWRQSVRTAESKETLIAEFSDSVTLVGTGHSWCVGSAKGAGCGGLCVFEADMCVDCRFGVITQEHRPVWQGIRDQQREALDLNDLGASGRSRAEKVLQRLGEEVQP